MTEPESLRQVLLRQVGVQPEAADVLGQLIREGHEQKASGKPISLMKSFPMPAARPSPSGARRRPLLSVAQILHRVVTPAPVKSKGPEDTRLRTPRDVEVRGKRPANLFEARVFRFLVRNHRALGLREVHRFKNQMIDGALVLTTGARVALEIKYRVGWDTACRSHWQIETFLAARPRGRRPYPYGVVIFGAFGGDWARARHGRAVGWDHWYRGYASLRGRSIRIALVQFATGGLRPYPSGRATID